LFDGLERLNENSLAAGARAVNHAVDALPLLGLHRNDEALAANGNQLLLNRAILGQSAEVTAQRLLDQALLLLHLPADARQFGRTAVGGRAGGQNLVAEGAQQGRKVGDRERELLHPLPVALDGLGWMRGNLAPLGGLVHYQEDVAKLGDLKR